MSSTVDGLVSGLDTTALVSQLMKIEALGQTALKSRLTTQKSVQSAYMVINSKLASVQSAAEGLIPTAFTNAWTAAKATSSSSTVAATAAAGASTGSLTFDVVSLARPNVVAATYAAPTDAALADGFTKVGVKIGAAAAVDVAVTVNTPQGVADAVNAANLGVRAAVVTTDQGTVVQFSSTKTGTAAAVSISNLAVPADTMVTATDAVIKVGDPGDLTDLDGDGVTTGYTARSGTNTFTGVLAGVTLSVSKLESDVTVTMGSDSGGIADKTQAVVDSLNSLLTTVNKYTAYEPDTKTASLLTGNFMLRSISERALSSISGGAGPGQGSLKAYGIELTRTGELKFDRTAFTAAYAADPLKTQAAISGALASKLKTLAVDQQKNVNAVIQNSDSKVRDLNTQIASWDLRLELRQSSLNKQFSGLEVALGKLRSQSSWLAGQLSAL